MSVDFSLTGCSVLTFDSVARQVHLVAVSPFVVVIGLLQSIGLPRQSVAIGTSVVDVGSVMSCSSRRTEPAASSILPHTTRNAPTAHPHDPGQSGHRTALKFRLIYLF